MNKLRILLWNCNNGLGSEKQRNYFFSFNPDIAIVPELKEHNLLGLSPHDSIWLTNNKSNPHPKGLGILAFNGWQLSELPRDEDMEIYIPTVASKEGIEIKILAIWNFYWACKQGRFKGVKGENCLEWEAIRHYADFLKSDCLMIGDFNFGPTFSQKAFVELTERLSELDMKSLYHEFYGLPVTESRHSTFVGTRQNEHHLDHIFGSGIYKQALKNFEIGKLEDAVLSDHAPLLAEFKL